MKLMKKIFLGSFVAIAVTGCAMTSEPYSIDTASSNIQPKTFVFKNVEMDGYKGLEDDSVKYAVKNYIEEYAAFNKCRSSLFGSNCSETGSSGIRNTWGSMVSLENLDFKLTYYSDKKYPTGRTDKATIDQLLPYSLNSEESETVLILNPPSAADAKPTTDAIGIPYSVPISDKNVVAWTASLFDEKKTISIPQSAVKTGEFDVELDPNSVRANLIRKFDLELVESSDDIQWKARTTRQLGAAEVNISLTVSLYRGETKVEYSMSHPFELKSDGTVRSFNKDIIDIALKQLIEAANS